MRIAAAVLTVLALAGLFPGLAAAQPAYLVRDLNTEPPDGFSGPPSSSPTPLLALSGRLFFTAVEISSGRELWVTDGSAQNTQLLADVCPGPCESEVEVVGTAGGLLLFSAVAEDGDTVLWRSDGTRRGTFPLASGGLPLVVSGRLQQGTALGRSLLVSACAGPAACGLWKTDGSLAGTTLLKSAEGFEESTVAAIAAAGNRAYFVVGGDFTSTGEAVLWKTDGTVAGTVQVKEIGDSASRLTFAGARLVFCAEDEDGDSELWGSDGTEAGTRPLTAFPRDPGFRWLRALGDKVYFPADDVVHGEEIWSSDGTPTGTRRVTNFGFASAFSSAFSLESNPAQVEQLGSQLLFLATDGLTGVRLWTLSGTGKLAPLAIVCPGDRCELPGLYLKLLKVGSRVFFPADDGTHGTEIWSSDGTAKGTKLLRDVCPGRCTGYFPETLVSQLGAALFLGETNSTSERFAIWRSDGTPEGTRKFARVGSTSNAFAMATLGGVLYYPAEDAYGIELWRSDGTSAGTRLVTDLARQAGGSDPEGLASLGSHLFFFACDGERDSLWRTSGNRGEAERVLADGQASCRRRSPGSAVSGGRLFFWRLGSSQLELWRTGEDGVPFQILADAGFPSFSLPELLPLRGGVAFLKLADDDGGYEVWFSDGNPAGTHKAFDLPAGIFLGLESLRVAGDELYFLASPDFGPADLWRSDGTQAGTRKLTAGDLFFSSLLIGRAPAASLFFAHPSGGQEELWRTDGTAAGTARVAGDFRQSFGRPLPTVPLSFQGAGYFFAIRLQGDEVAGLWRTDGTEAGTTLVKSFALLSEFDTPEPELRVAGGRLFFAADDGVHGRELWTSDGTPAGTLLVRDLVPGTGSAAISSLREAGGSLWFQATDGVNGLELWTSDGTAAGTRLVQDLAPQAASSLPAEATAAGGHLFWSADDGLSGRELWALSLPGGSGACQAEADALCLGGRFKVEAAWRDPAGNAGAGQAVGLTADTGYFWFFNASNVEVVIKVLDGVGVNGHFWVFYGALSNVEYTLTVTDAQTGLVRRYFSPSGRLVSVGDTTAFGPLGAFPSPSPGSARAPAVVAREAPGRAPKAECAPSVTRLCLNGGRFAVEASWKLPGRQGVASAVGLTGDTGYLWFFDASNVEVVVKVLDGRGVNGKFWVFAGALSSVEYRITVTDTMTGTVKTYDHPNGELASFADTAAF